MQPKLMPYQMTGDMIVDFSGSLLRAGRAIAMTVTMRFHMQTRARNAAKVAAATLVFSLMVLHAALFSQVARHSLQHAHHQAATHGSLLCTWLCTAGEISEAVDLDLRTSLAMHRGREPRSPRETFLPLSIESSSRAPPLGSPSIPS